jgi:hypothetical protein
VKFLKTILFAAVAILTTSLASCGGGGSNPTPPPIAVSFSAQPPASLTASTTTAITANVSNDNASAGVKWTVTCGSSICGSFNPTSTPSGIATTYEAPANIPTNNTITVTATSVSDSTKSASASITITAAAGITVSFAAQAPDTLVHDATTNLTAVVSADSANAGVTWSVTCESAACGSFNPTSTPSNGATVYTAPAAIPVGSAVTVRATSVTDTTKSASTSISIVNAALADGTYIFRLSGEDQYGVYYSVGAFTVQSGNISGGEMDYVDPNGGKTNMIPASGSSLSTESNGNLQIALTTGDAGVGKNGVLLIRAAAVSPSRALITEFDAGAAATGTLDLQSSKAAPSGGYAFNLSGLDGNDPSLILGIGGVISISGTSVNVTKSVLDYNDSGNTAQAQVFTSGSVTPPDSFGRVTISLQPSEASGLPQFGLSGYIVSANRIHLIEDLDDSLEGVLGGTAIGQGANAGNFTAASASGASYAYGVNGIDTGNGGLLQMGGGFGLNADGTVGGALVIADLDCCGSVPITGGTWTIDPTGRVTISNLITASNIKTPLNFQLYLDGNGNALELGVDQFEVTAGSAFAQVGMPGTGTYAIGAQGFSSVNDNQPVWSAAGPIMLDNILNWSGSTDYNVFGGDAQADALLSGTTNTTRGLLQINGLDVTNSGTDGYGYFPIDASRLIAIEVDNNQLGLIYIEAVTPANQ